PGHCELGEATLRADWGEARLEVTRWTPEKIEVRGSTGALTVSGAARAFGIGDLPRSTLVVAGAWDIRATEFVEGTVSVDRVSGDLRVGEPPVALGLEALSLKIDAARGRARARVEVRGTQA